jgi:3(or 17)beta-hydroxysteroid dehydrogenase
MCALRLEGKVALITGAASGIEGEVMGIGGSSARLFAREGARVVVTDLDTERGETTVAQIEAEGTPGGAVFVPLNVTEEEQWERAIQTAVSTYGRLDILVHCAGTATAGTVENTGEEEWDGMMAVHAKGVFLGTKHAIPHMRKVGGGSVVVVSSIDALVGGSHGTAYSAAKGASRSFTKSAAIQHAAENIRVNSVHPGYTDTPLARRVVSEIMADGSPDPRIPRVPLQRLAAAQEIAKPILFLASDEASYITGTEVVIDGGITAQ